jgi:hypothetical protein
MKIQHPILLWKSAGLLPFVTVLLLMTWFIACPSSSATDCPETVSPMVNLDSEPTPVEFTEFPLPPEQGWGTLIVPVALEEPKRFKDRHPKVYKLWRKARHVCVVVGPVVTVITAVGSIALQVAVAL